MGEFGGSNSCVGKVCTKLYAAVALQHSGEVHLVTVSPNKSRNSKLRISRRPGDKEHIICETLCTFLYQVTEFKSVTTPLELANVKSKCEGASRQIIGTEEHSDKSAIPFVNQMLPSPAYVNDMPRQPTKFSSFSTFHTLLHAIHLSTRLGSSVLT